MVALGVLLVSGVLGPALHGVSELEENRNPQRSTLALWFLWELARHCIIVEKFLVLGGVHPGSPHQAQLGGRGAFTCLCGPAVLFLIQWPGGGFYNRCKKTLMYVNSQ